MLHGGTPLNEKFFVKTQIVTKLAHSHFGTQLPVLRSFGWLIFLNVL